MHQIYHKTKIINIKMIVNMKDYKQNGMYDASYEHDACGVGMVVNIHGNKSHELVDSAQP